MRISHIISMFSPFATGVCILRTAFVPVGAGETSIVPMSVLVFPGVWPAYTLQETAPSFPGRLQSREPTFAESQYLKPCRRFS